MWKFSYLLLLALFAYNLSAQILDEESAPNKLIFSKRGKIAATSSFAHCSFDINITDAKASIAFSRDLLYRLTTKVTDIMSNWDNVTSATLDKRTEVLFWDFETSKIHDQLGYQTQQLDILAESIAYKEQRQKRQVLAAGLAAITGLLIGGSLFTLPEIATLRSAMSSNEQNIHLISHDLGQVTKVLSSQDKVLHRISAKLRQLEVIAHGQDIRRNLLLLRHNMNQLSQNQKFKYDIFASGLKGILEGHITSNLVSLVEAEAGMTVVKKRAESRGLSLVFPHPLDFYKCQSTLFRTATPGILAVYIHVPLFRPPLFFLYEYLPLPLYVASQNKTATPQPDHAYLIVNPQRNLYQTMTSSQLSNCQSSYQNDVTFCSNSQPFRKDFENDCLASLYRNDPSAIVANCKFGISPADKEVILSKDDSSFLVFSPHKISVRVSCDDHDADVTVHGYHHLKVNSSCSISSPNYFSRVEASIKQGITLSASHVSWNASEVLSILPHFTGLNLSSLDTALSSHSDLLSDLQQNVLQLQASVASSAQWGWVHYHSLTTTGVVLLIIGLLIVAGVLLCRRFRQRLNIAQPPPLINQQAGN